MTAQNTVDVEWLMVLLPLCYLPEIVLDVSFFCCYYFITDVFIYTYTDFGLN